MIVKTTYEPIDKEWLNWYIARLAKHPEHIGTAADIQNNGDAVYITKDPTSETIGTTIYEVIP